ncbi:MAG: hypothetical protein KDK41_12510, partial [Leptospiraceae bacterium]|nr:hypothetical protein [Leptospiraceae bacterium]
CSKRRIFKSNSLKFATLSVLVMSMFAFGPCSSTTNAPEQKPQKYSYSIGTPAAGNQTAKTKLLETINSATKELVMAFSDFNDADVLNAILAKESAGLKIAIAGDQRAENSTSFAALKAMRTSSNKFNTTKTAFANAVAASTTQAENEALRTRLNFNRQNFSAQYNASRNDGRVEYNIVVADNYKCWISTSPPVATTWSNDYSIVFFFDSYDVCRDFYNELNQPAWGGLFGDEGIPSFGRFRWSKSIVDPNTSFRIDDVYIHIWYSPQEWPIVGIITELMRADDSIEFAARALTQERINDVNDHSKNRSTILNVLQQKSRYPTIFGKSFSIKGVFGTELDPNPTCVAYDTATPPNCTTTITYNSLVAGTCPTINNVSIALPYDSTTNSTINQTSIHCDLLSLKNTVNNSSTLAVSKYSGRIPFNVFLLDKGGRRPRLIISPSDLRYRYFYDSGGSQNAEPQRTQDDFFPITDSFVMMIEPINFEARAKIFNDFSKLVDILYQAGAQTW